MRVSVRDDVVEIVRKMQTHIGRAQAELNVYLAGVRAGMGLDSEYKFDAEKMEFSKEDEDAGKSNSG